MSKQRTIPHQNIAGQHAAMKDEIIKAVGGVIDGGMFIAGEEVAEFERRFAELIGVRFALGVNSGTDALVMALRVLGIGPGDEVITAPNSFVSSASCIALLGAKPVFIDVGEDYNLDPSLIEQAITSRTRAILPIHLTGRPADMERIMAIANERNLHVIEDCAQAVCAEFKEQRVGSFGTFGCFSLHPLKTLNACGDGGIITTNDPDLYAELKYLRNCGLWTRDECVIWGYNSRLDTMQAAILLCKLRYVEQWTEGRQANARFYQKHLSGLPQIQVPKDKPGEQGVYHTFVIQADQRDELQRYLGERGIGTLIHYPIPIHMQKAAEDLGHRAGSFPVTERQASRILSLPVYPELTTEDLEYIVSNLREFYKTGQADAGSVLISTPTIC